MRAFAGFSSLTVALVVLSSASTAFAGSPASSEELIVRAPAAMGETQYAVPLWDLALKSAKGQKELSQRLKFAIASLCEDGGSSSDPIYSLKCDNSAWKSVESQLAGIAR